VIERDALRSLLKCRKVPRFSPYAKEPLPYFSSKLTWIPGNGAKIKIWEDSILGEQPLTWVSEIRNIKDWLLSNNCRTLWDISLWKNDDNESWEGWNLGNYPDKIKEEATLLLDSLQGKSPISVRSKDKRGWGSELGLYTTAPGYSAILGIPWVPPNPAPWKALWNFPSIPKVDIFMWTLLHNSILTNDNLKRKGWEGPSHCPLCNQAEETTVHLLLNCDFSKEAWDLFLGSVSVNFPSSALELLSNWMSLSPFNLSKKNLLKTIWMWTPKFLCWKLWLERNNRIFKEESRMPSQVAIKARTMLSEALNSKTSIRNSTPLSVEEECWIKEIIQNQPGMKETKPPQKRNWEIWMEEQDFLKWISALDEWCLFFDGASKGNPGQARGGGIITEPSGTIHLSYAWGLGHVSNNHAEYLALWQGLIQALKLNVQKIRIFGDSKLVVEALNSKKIPKDITLAHMYKKILLLLPQFREYKIFHILRTLNGQADTEANRGTLLSKTHLTVNGETSHQEIP
jgi:ribonuclease HI